MYATYIQDTWPVEYVGWLVWLVAGGHLQRHLYDPILYSHVDSQVIYDVASPPTHSSHTTPRISV